MKIVSAVFETIEQAEAAAAKIKRNLPETGVEISAVRVLSSGKRTMEFDFGARKHVAAEDFGSAGASATASNWATALFLPLNSESVAERNAASFSYGGEYGFEPSYAPKVRLAVRCKDKSQYSCAMGAIYSCGAYDINESGVIEE